jgi:hypothetical protein
MTLTLYMHPLASFCQKALIALYENDTPFEPHFLDLGDPNVRAEFNALWPIGKMPALRDSVRGEMVPEATVIIEYLAIFYPGRRASSRKRPISPGKPGSPTASTISMCTSRCRRSSPTSCVRKGGAMRMASRPHGRRC